MIKVKPLITVAALSLSYLAFADDDLSLSAILNLQPNIASMTGTEKKDAPSTINTITAAEIKESTARNVSDALMKLQPGFMSIEHLWVTPVWGFRGVINDRSENVLLNVNGEMQNSLSKKGVDGEAYLGLMNDIKVIDTISGPGSVIHGPGALTGVVNIELKDGSEMAHDDEVVFRLGSDRDYSGEYAKRFKLEGDRLVRLDVGYLKNKETGGEYWGDSGYGGTNPQQHQSGRDFDGNVRVTGVYTDKANKIKGFLRYYDAKYENGLLNSVASNYPGRTSGSLSRRHFDQNLSTSAEKTFGLSSKFDAKSTVGFTMSHSGMERSRDGTFDTSGWRAGGLTYNGDLMDGVGEMRVRARGDLIFKDDLNPFVIAAEVRHDRYESNLFGDSKASNLEWKTNLYPGKVIPNKQYNNIAVFGEYQSRIFGKWLTPFVGARYDKHTEFSTFAPRFALTSAPLEGHSLRAVYQSAYKALSVDNIVGNMESNTVPKSGQDPSSSKSWEVGHRYVKGNIETDLVYYFNDLLIYSWNDTAKTQQAVKARTNGVELKIMYKGENWKALLSHQYTGLAEKNTTQYFGSTQTPYREPNFLENVTRLKVDFNFLTNWYTSATSMLEWSQKGAKELTVGKESSRNIQWIGQEQVKFDLQVGRKIKDGSIALNFENLAGLINKKYEGRQVLDMPVLEKVDYPKVSLAYERQF